MTTQPAPVTKLNRSVRLGQINPPVEVIGAVFMSLHVHNSIGVSNEGLKFTLSDKPNRLRV
jgi:hypothetical protein